MDRMTIDEAARFTGLKKNTIYTYASRGAIPCHRSRGRIYFYREELAEWKDRPDSTAGFEILPWMTQRLALAGDDLVVYAVLYHLLKPSQHVSFQTLVRKVASMSGIGEDRIPDVIAQLGGRGLVADVETIYGEKLVFLPRSGLEAVREDG